MCQFGAHVSLVNLDCVQSNMPSNRVTKTHITLQTYLIENFLTLFKALRLHARISTVIHREFLSPKMKKQICKLLGLLPMFSRSNLLHSIVIRLISVRPGFRAGYI